MTKRRHVFAALVLLAVRSGSLHAQDAKPITWTTTAKQIGNHPAGILLACPAHGSVALTWGTGSYTDDSSICTAAAHQGLFKIADGGLVFMQTGPGEVHYDGSTRYGVTTQAYGSWDASFYVSEYEPPPVVDSTGAPVPVKKTPPAIPVIAWTSTAQAYGPNGAKFTRRCPANGRIAAVFGDVIYSSNSSICGAAVHAGAITAKDGGVVMIQMRLGSRTYLGVPRNGVKSAAGEGTLLGFEVLVNRK